MYVKTKDQWTIRKGKYFCGNLFVTVTLLLLLLTIVSVMQERSLCKWTLKLDEDVYFLF